MTPLSHQRPKRTREIRSFFPLARLSLCTAVMLGFASSCVVSDPPVYGVAQQTPPVLFLDEADPSVFEVLRVNPGDTRSIKVPFRSEDAGEDLIALLYLNYIPGQVAFLQTFRVIKAGTFDQERDISMTWQVPDAPSLRDCQQLTLVVVHLSGFDGDKNTPLPAAQPGTAVWWVDIGGTTPGTLVNCPGGGE